MKLLGWDDEVDVLGEMQGLLYFAFLAYLHVQTAFDSADVGDYLFVLLANGFCHILPI